MAGIPEFACAVLGWLEAVEFQPSQVCFGIIHSGNDGVMEAHLNQEEMASVQTRLVPNLLELFSMDIPSDQSALRRNPHR